MAGQLEIYNQEIFNFLKTVTIKFNHFAWAMSDGVRDATGHHTPDFADNPYYQRLNGNYCANDTKIMVTTVEDGTTVEFNKDLINTYPQTAALYHVPNKEYDILINQYPAQADLIKNIVYPVDISTAIAAPDFSLLGYDDSLLELNEREDLVNCLKTFLKYVETRWWVDEYIYEELYAPTFWAMLWQQLPLLLLTRRFENIRTPYAHSHHVWEYLQSHGMPDYRDVLSSSQYYWLYRNQNYIYANRGKNKTLRILGANLLPSVAVSLLYYDMYQETATRWADQLSTGPMFRAYQIIDDEYVREENFGDLNYKLFDLNVVHRNDAEYYDETERQLSSHGHNVLATKFLEFKKEPIDTRTERVMVNFMLDTLFYRLSKNKAVYKCHLRDPLTTADYELSISDVILLWHYACWKTQGVEPSRIPTKAVVRLPFKLAYPGDRAVNRVVYSNGFEYPQWSVLNLEVLRKRIPYSDTAYADSTAFMNNVVKQLAAYLLIINEAEQSNRKEYHDCIMEYLKDVTDPCVVNLQLTSLPNYAAWINTENVAPLVTAYSEVTDPVDMERRFGALAKACFDAMLPTANVELTQFVSTARNMEVVYQTIRDLFIRLGSYNVFYLETARDRNEYITFRDPDVYFPLNMEFNFDYILGWTHESFALDITYSTEFNVGDIPVDNVTDNIIPSIHYSGDIGYDANITDLVISIFPKFTAYTGNEITNMEFIWSCDTLLPVEASRHSINLKVYSDATIS